MTFAEFVGHFNRMDRRNNFSTEAMRYLYNVYLANGGGKVDPVGYASAFTEFTPRELYEYDPTVQEYVDEALRDFEGLASSDDDLEDAFNSSAVQRYLDMQGIVKLPDSYIRNN